jgi:Helix-turn-helix domain of resolvase
MTFCQMDCALRGGGPISAPTIPFAQRSATGVPPSQLSAFLRDDEPLWEFNHGPASLFRGQFNEVITLLNAGAGASAISAQTGLTRQSILRIRNDRTSAERALALWDSE